MRMPRTPSCATASSTPADLAELAGRRDEEPHARSADPRYRRQARRRISSPNAAESAAPFRSTPRADAAELGVVPTAEARCELADARPSGPTKTCV